MQDAEFKAWLEKSGYAANTVNTQMAQSRRLDQAYGDLDDHFDRDKFASLLETLTYTADDKRNARPNPSKIPINGDVYSNLASYRASLSFYQRFRDDIAAKPAGGATSADQLFMAGMERLKDTFLERMPDFGGFELEYGDFFETEQQYKMAARGEVIQLSLMGETAEERGRAVYKRLSQATRQGLPLSWRTQGEVQQSAPELQREFYETVSRLARLEEDDLPGLEDAARSFEALRAKGLSGLKRGEVLGITISIFGTLNPHAACWFKVRTFDRLGKLLLGKSLFRSARFELTDFLEFQSLMRRIEAVLEGWGWRPAALDDVQGFIWVAMADNWGSEHLAEVTREAVEQAMDECEDIGVDAFLQKYQFGRPRDYWTRREAAGMLFPAKAMVGAAYGFMPGGKPQSAKEFYHGFGEQEAIATLEGLGFEIVNGKAVSMDQSGETAAAKPTNLILYGPPGTGKTYATAAEAVRLCTGTVPASREALMGEYQALFRKGRIGFVTFHQSYSYEEFVEGLRPDTSGPGDEGSTSGAGFSLRPHAGIFKQIANLAGENRGRALANDKPVIDRSQKVFKMSLGRAGIDDHIFEAAIEGRYVSLGWGGDVDWSDARFDEWEAIRDRWKEDHPEATGFDPNITQTYTLRVNMEVGSLVVISDGNNRFRAIGEVTGPYQFRPGPDGAHNHRRPVRWLWSSDESLPRERIYGKGFSQVSAYQLNSRYLDWDALEQVVLSGGEAVETTGVPEPYVLIIDEINRANISKVFGELITLLEADKRIDGENELRVKLPYSGETFGIPANLHVIGTMNTADRSIALLDTALRRRFTFRELMPDSSVLPADVEGVPVRQMLDTLNRRIEYLFDREHQIGHAYFMGCASRADVDACMRHNVIPLLAEYFYEDWSKVAAVLGDGDGQRFLQKQELKAPDGLDPDGDAPSRWRWSVRAEFAPDAYSAFG